MKPVTRAEMLPTVALTASLLLGACASQPPRADAHARDLAAIEAFNERYLEALNAGNIAALSALTDDGHVMSAPNRPPVIGKTANDAANGAAFENFTIQETWSPIETAVEGDLAYQRGAFTVTAAPKSGGSARVTHGNYLRIYRRQPDGSWRMTRDMFNSDEPARP